VGPLGIPSGLDGDLQGNFQVDQEKVASAGFGELVFEIESY